VTTVLIHPVVPIPPAAPLQKIALVIVLRGMKKTSPEICRLFKELGNEFSRSEMNYFKIKMNLFLSNIFY